MSWVDDNKGAGPWAFSARPGREAGHEPNDPPEEAPPLRIEVAGGTNLPPLRGPLISHTATR